MYYVREDGIFMYNLYFLREDYICILFCILVILYLDKFLALRCSLNKLLFCKNRAMARNLFFLII